MSAAANEYRTGTAASRGHQLEPVYDTLIARVDGLSVNGQPLLISGMPTKGDIESLVGEDLELSKPLSEARMTIEYARKSGKVESKEVKLGDTINAFQKLVEQKRAELGSLLNDFSDVNDELAATKKDIMHAEAKEVKHEKSKLNAELLKLAEEAKVIKEQTLTDIKNARKEDKDDQADRNRRFMDYMREE